VPNCLSSRRIILPSLNSTFSAIAFANSSHTTIAQSSSINQNSVNQNNKNQNFQNGLKSPVRIKDVFKEFYISQLNALLKKKEQELQAKEQELKKIQDEIIQQKELLLSLAQRQNKLMTIRVKPKKPAFLKKSKILPEIKVYGISCNGNVCSAYTNFGVLGIGDKLATGEIIKEITPKYIKTDKRKIELEV
jgi:hypothetical protein